MLAQAAGLLFALVTAVHLVSHLLDSPGWSSNTQPLLIPPVALWLFASTRAPRPLGIRLALFALGFSWLGDTAPRFLTGSAAFLGMVGFFLVAQGFYAVAFFPYRARAILRRPLWLAPYLALGVGLVLLCAPRAGPLLPLIAIYATAIVCMAVLATGLGWAGAVGGALFVLSDSLIALRAFTDHLLPLHGFWVMLTYVVAQLLLIFGVYQAAPISRPEPAPRLSVAGEGAP